MGTRADTVFAGSTNSGGVQENSESIMSIFEILLLLFLTIIAFINTFCTFWGKQQLLLRYQMFTIIITLYFYVDLSLNIMLSVFI